MVAGGAGRTIVNVEPIPGLESSSTWPPWASAIARTIESPRPAPSGLGAEAVGARAKRSKIRSRSAAVDAGTLVAHPEPRGFAHHRAADPDRVALARVADRVVGEVHHRLGEPVLVGDDDPDAGAVEAPVAVAEAARLGEQVVREEVEVDRTEAEEVRARRLRQQQQVVDVAAHPVELVLDHRDRLLALGR